MKFQIKQKFQNKLNNASEMLISSCLKPMADTMLKTAYELELKHSGASDTEENFKSYSEEFYVLYKQNYAKRKEKKK